MTDIRRTVLWVVFAMSLVFLWDGWQKHNGKPSMFESPAPKPVASTGTAPSAAPGTPAAAAAGTVPAAAAAAAVGEKLVITTDVMNVTLDTLGGDVVRAELPKYLSAPEPGVFDPLLEVVGIKKKTEVAKHPVVLMDAARGYEAQSGLVGTKGEQLPTHNTPMTAVTSERQLKDGSDLLVVKLESAEIGGVKLAKTFTFKRGDYVIDVKHEVVNVGTAPVTPQLYVQLVRDGHVEATGPSMAPSSFTGPAVYTDKSAFRPLSFEDINKGKAEYEKTAGDGWVAMVQHYFVSAWLPKGAGTREFFAQKVEKSVPEQYRVGMVFTLPQLAPGATATQEDRLLIGPAEENKLEALAPGLELVKDYGIFSMLAKPLFWLLDQLHKLIGNWGWSIIALVVLLKIAFYWLNASAYRSMAKMKAINPKVQELRERYKDKPQQMQQEMMKIYREEKVNPIGGCLPILLQMPFFIALYWVLLTSVEMRGAPWLGWITDLSAKDPYLILPLLMTLSSLFQVWLNPTPPDPTQAKMMWIMPLAFSVMFFVFPSGLVLYWLTNNILSIAQQWMINKQLGVQN